MTQHVGRPGSNRSNNAGRWRRLGGAIGASLFVVCAWLAPADLARAADLNEAEDLRRQGRYDDCAALAADELKAGAWAESWSLVKIRAELARGKDADALKTLEEGLRRVPWSLPLYLIGREVYLANGRDAEAMASLDRAEALIVGNPRRYGSAEDRVALGRFFLLRGVDARKVLDQFFDLATKARPDLVETYLATADLALAKQDGALAAETLAKAPKEAAEDPKYHALLAQAFSESDRVRSEKAIDDALAINPDHAESLLVRVDHLIDSERYERADGLLDRVLGVNPREPRAWAFRAVLAHLKNDPAGESEARAKGLERRKTDPVVDHTLGRELSQKYRFAEGAACQRKALELDPGYLPAKVQLCQDLLRLGDEDAGWALADAIFQADPYNVVAYNLINLRDRLKGFRDLEADGFVVRMDPREADLYGDRVLDLLTRARSTLNERYGVEVPGPVVVEIFPAQKEFAVRTFGLPGADGLLGVCFGRVITANSPASQGESPSNWEAVLWHEYCHVATLTKTRNRMPRWLSEGISVFEEGREQPAWDSGMTPRFREMILGDAFTPLSRLSSAFLDAESGQQIQFAYFESALAVEFLVDRYGLPALKGLLDDLGAGKTINEALPDRAGLSLNELDEGFARFARRKAEAVAPEATWEEPGLPPDADSETLAAWLAEHPKNFWGHRRLAARLVAERKWDEAIRAIETFRALGPDYLGPDNAPMLLAAVHRARFDPAAERSALEEVASRDGDAASVYLRLMELDEEAADWPALAEDARRLLAVNPLIPAPHRQLARAAEHLGRTAEAITAYRAIALLDDTDPAGVHFRLASLLHQDGQSAEARRQALKALEEAPRFREAHRLLLEIVEPSTGR